MFTPASHRLEHWMLCVGIGGCFQVGITGGIRRNTHLSNIEATFGVQLSADDILTAPTIEELARKIDAWEAPSGNSGLIRLQPHSHRPPLEEMRRQVAVLKAEAEQAEIHDEDEGQS